MARGITPEEEKLVVDMVARARAAMDQIKDYDQARVDRLCQAIGWATGNEKTFVRIAQMGVDESGIGDREGRAGKRFKVLGVLRDALRQKSVGVIEVDEKKGVTKIAKPAGVIASLIPTTNPELTPPVTGIYALKCKDAVIFSPHPRARHTTFEMVRVMRETLRSLDAPEDIFQCVERPSIPLTGELMAACDLTLATGGKPMVRAAYSSGKPAFGVGAGNSTMVIDETADIAEAARNSRISKTSDFGSGCSADGNLLIDDRIYDRLRDALVAEGGYLCNTQEKAKLEKAMWDAEGHRTINTVAVSAQQIGAGRGLRRAGGPQVHHGRAGGHRQGAQVLLREALRGDGDLPLPRLRRRAAKSRADLRGRRQGPFLRHLFVRRRSHRAARRGRAGQPHDGAPAAVEGQRRRVHQRHADDLEPGLRHLGRQHHQRERHLKHYMNVTWVSRPIPEDRPTEAELFGEFYNTQTL